MLTHRRLSQTLSTLVVLTLLFSGFPLPSASAQGSNGIKRQVNTQTGKLSFIGPENGHTLSAARALGMSIRPQDPAMALAKRFGPEFGLKDPERDLKELKSNHSGDGRIRVRYQQKYEDIPVMAGELIVNTNKNGDLYSINGEISPNLTLSTQPTIDSKQAQQTALQAMAKWYQKAPEDFVASETELWIYDESLLRPSTRPAELVWRMEVSSVDNSLPIRELVLVNAQRGSISLHFNQIDTSWAVEGSSGLIQDAEPTPTPLSPETQLLAETPDGVVTDAPVIEEITATEDISISNEARAQIAVETGSTWHVATTGNDSNSCATPASPCATINGAIAKASVGDTVMVGEGTYYGSGENVVTISKSITLSGGWDSVFSLQSSVSVIDGEHSRRGIYINTNSSGSVNIDYFVIKNGYSSTPGGGINVDRSTLTLSNSLLVGNVANQGGGIAAADSNLGVQNTTVSSNDANEGLGGGILFSSYVSTKTLKIVNSTIAYNTASTAGGGINTYGVSEEIFSRSIIAHNQAPVGAECRFQGGAIDSADHNIIMSEESCAMPAGSNNPVDPMMTPVLVGNPGYHALFSDSPAIDAGGAACLTTDQRGVARPQGGACDIGAYEHPASISSVISSLLILNGNHQRAFPNAPFPISVRIGLVNSEGDLVEQSGIPITLTAPNTGPSLIFADTEDITATATTNQQGVAGFSAMTANNKSGSYEVLATSLNLSSISMNFKNVRWYVSPTGNDLSACDQPTLPCATINGVLAKSGLVAGDTIYVAAGTYTGTGSGGNVVSITDGVHLSGGWDTEFVSQTGFSIIDGENTHSGISVYDFPPDANETGIDRFVVKNSRGGIFNNDQLTISNSSIHSNSYGGITHYGPSLILNNVVISNNTNSGSEGGGIRTGKSSIVMNNVTIAQNQAYAGGGIYYSPPYGTGILSIQMSNTIIAGNTSTSISPDCNGPIISLGHNIIGNTNGCTITASVGDQLNVNPRLGAFLPELGFHPLLPDSPAINAGGGCYGTTDQRGVVRADTCDIGAYEYIAPGPATSLSIIGGDHQTTAPNTLFVNPLQIVAQDSKGNLVPGVPITFTAPANGPSAIFTGNNSTIATYQTDISGGVVTSPIQANNQLGSYEIAVSAPGVENSIHFTLENLAWYVAPTGLDTNSCKSPDFPCATLGGVLIKIKDRDKIFVAEGVYTGIDYQVAFIKKSVTISGGWNSSFTDQAGVSIVDGQNVRKGLNIGAGVSVSIEKFVIINGLGAEDGGGINNAGELTLNSVGIANSTAIRGGGIRNAGNLILNNVTIANNTTSAHGGGIYNEGVVNINNTTISNNSTKIRGGGIYNRFTQYGESQKIVQIKNSIIANNIVIGDGSSNSYGPDCAENIISLGNNIISSISGCSIVAASGDKFNLDPKLSTLIAGLGYQPLQAGSPAINAGNPSACPAQDQRGSPRVGGCDIGAYEYRTPGAAVSIYPVVNNLRLRPGAPATIPLQVVAVDQWKTPVSGVTIALTAPLTGPSGVFGNGMNTISASTDTNGIASLSFTTNHELGTYVVDAYSPALNKHTAISVTNFGWFVATAGNDSNDCYTPISPCATINGALSKAINGDAIYVAEGRYVKIGNDYLGMIVNITKSVTIVGGWNAAFTGPGNLSIIDGEGIYSGVGNSAANVALSRLIVENVGDGQVGIDSSGNLVLDQIAVINGKGTGVSNYEGTLTIQNSTISQNQGHGLSNSEGNTTVKNSTITNNKVTYLGAAGGGIRTVNGTITIWNSIISGNSAPEAPDCNAYTTNSFIVSNGNNIIGTTIGCSITPKPGDKFNTDPLLLPLLPLGYQPLSPGSPALHSGNPSTCTATDQRGVPRLTNGKCDIGAYELQPVGPTTRLMSVHTTVLRTPINTSFPDKLKVVALDQYGTPVSGVVIEFRLPTTGSSGTFSGNTTTTVITDSQGLAISPTLTANSEYGDYVATVSANGISTPVTISLHNGAWLVSSITGNDSNNCLLPASPCASIKGVLDKKEFNSGEVIWVSTGTYDTASNYYIRDEVTILGGWNTSFSSAGGATVLKESYTISGSIQVKIRQVVFQGSMAGLRNEATLTLENAAIYQTDLGITNSRYGNLTLVNVTMSKNRNIALINEGEALLLNSTITENRGFVVGGIRNEVGVIRLKNTIVAGNITTSPADNASADCQGQFISLDHNIIGTIGSYNVVAHNYDCRSNWMAGDILGSDNEGLIPLDQILDTTIIQDPVTGQWVYPLKADGVAVDVGTQDCPLTDQRGISRPQGSSCDSGAYEIISRLNVTKANDTNDGVCDEDCSLREAINAASDGDRVYFAPALFDETITVGSTLPMIDKSITIDARGRSITVDGADVHRIFEVLSTGYLTINGLTLQNGRHNGSCTMDINDSCGGAIYNNGKLTVKNSTFFRNSADLGGAIFIENGISDISNSTFVDNSATFAGGIYSNDVSTLTLTNNTFSDNSATQGADLYNVGNLHFANNILANSASGDNCYNENGAGEVLTDINNLVETNAASPNHCGTPAMTSDPKLGPLANNGGFTQTMALGTGSPAIDAGNDAYCSTTDQRGVTRPQGNHCDLGAYEFPDTTPPTIASIVRASTNHTSGTAVNFTVTFSEAVRNVDVNDFIVSVTGGISGANVSTVTGTGSTRTVTVNTGSCNGLIGLRVPADASITDLPGNSLAGLPFTNSETYTILKVATFTDVETGYWAWQYVERLVNAGITAGCGSGSYCPGDTVTRAQMAVFLERGMHGYSYAPPAVGGSTGFGDVLITHWAGAWIKQLAADGITGGCGSGIYCPENPVTRGQMAVFLLRAKHGSSYTPPDVGAGTGFGDVSASYWSAAWIKQLVAEGITAGCGTGTYCPEARVTRAQMAVFLVKTFNLP